MSIKQASSLPPLDGSLTAMPGFVDFYAEKSPDALFAIWESSASQDGLFRLTYPEFAKATHRVAHMLRPGRTGKDGEVVAIVIHTDSVLYCALLMGCIRAGFVPYPMSPRNSTAAICNMMEKTSVHRIIAEPSTSSLVSDVRAELRSKNHTVDIIGMPSLSDVFPGLQRQHKAVDNFTLYPQPSRKVALTDTVVILHSSGSTGFPKAIPLNHEFVLNWGRCEPIMSSRERGLQWFGGALPTFHAFGFIWQLMLALTSGLPVAHFPPMHPAPPVVPNPENTLESSRKTLCNALPAVPAFVEAWTRLDNVVAYLKSLHALAFAGGPLSKKCGDDLAAQGVKLSSVYAATEFGLPTPIFYPEPKAEQDRTPMDWEWVRIDKRFKPRWEDQGDGSYELHFLTCETHRPAIENLPDVRGYATSDLFIPHPTKPDLWKVTGRKDDVIVLASAEKIVPLPQEGHILSSSMVKGAVMFGRGREQAGVLIEPSPQYQIDPNDEPALIDFRNKIWKVVDEANQITPAFARIFKEMIIVTDPAKPLPRAAKGTVIRKQVYMLYEAAIDQLYETVENSSNSRETRPPQSWELAEVERWLTETAASVNDEVPVEPTIDLFQQGFDSLSATFLRTRIVAALRMTRQGDAARKITQNFVFDHPTVKQLAAATHLAVFPESGTPSVTADILQQTRDMIAKYTADMPARSLTRRAATQDIVVLLTGSTGNLGSHVLATLLADDRVSKVFSMDRQSKTHDSSTRIIGAFEDRGLPTNLLNSRKFVTLTGDFNLPNFGLEQNVYEELSRSVTCVIHNAWAVHFTHGLPFFESLIAGTRHLVDFGLSVGRPIRILFTSSVATAHAWQPENGYVPEAVLPDNDTPPVTGYAASKFVVEHIFAKAREQGLDASCLRVGQLCGSRETGAWNTTDWVPILLKSSITLGAFPDAQGPVDWISMDAVANLVLDLIFSEEAPTEVLNVVHPRPISWEQTIRDINAALGLAMPMIPLEAWVSEVSARSANTTQKTLEEVPAIKLMDFFNGMVSRNKAVAGRKLPVDALGFAMLATEKLQHFSKTVRELPPLDQEYARAWIGYWRERNALPR